MLPVRLTRDIDTLRGILPAGLCLFVLSWGEFGEASLCDCRKRLVVSMAPDDSFEEINPGPMTDGIDPAEEFTKETRSHGEEHEIESRLHREAGIDGAREIETNDHRLLPPVPVETGSPMLEAGPAKPAQDQQQVQLESVVGDGQSEALSIGPQPTAHVVDSPEGTARTDSVLTEECPFEPNIPSGPRPSALGPRPDSDPNAELSALAQREPAPLVNREESIRLACLVPRVIEVSPTLSDRVREMLEEFGYVLVDRDDRNYDPRKSQREFTTEARRHGGTEKRQRSGHGRRMTSA